MADAWSNDPDRTTRREAFSPMGNVATFPWEATYDYRSDASTGTGHLATTVAAYLSKGDHIVTPDGRLATVVSATTNLSGTIVWVVGYGEPFRYAHLESVRVFVGH